MFSLNLNSSNAARFYSSDKVQGTFMKFDSVLHEIEIGGGTAINATVIRTENMDISNQETNFNLKSNKFYALEFTNGPRESGSYLRLDTKQQKVVLGRRVEHKQGTT